MQARILELPHKTVEKLLALRKEAEAGGAYRVARRIHAVLLNHDGRTSGEIADVLQGPRSRVSEWLKNYAEHGLDGLLEGYRPGRPAALNSLDRQALADIVDSGPVA